jgi:1-acyl-sn-glycerol-3-phosphate acyltransferase
MLNFLKLSKIHQILKTNPEQMLFKIMPLFVMEIINKYLRVEIEGLENIPRRGAGIILPNHSGFSGFDAFILSYTVQKHTKRIPRVLTHYFWFLNKNTAIPANKLGFTEATFENGVSALKKKNLVILFPEGEAGNFKPSKEKYQLQPFKRGFARMAVASQSAVIPTLIIGAEETHINLSQIKLSKFLKGLIIPLPLNFIPLPAKWKIIFLPPVQLPFSKDKVEDRELMMEIAEDFQELMQTKLSERLKTRKKVFL